ncbi:unnamed protein product [Rotaria socialis]|uniref:PLAT domain-containing protein n=2 Tax=Rotaria socialis TaxID=392032 RepID=A0A818DUC6_9BILA|nr:unnamed protein product [Rotaria socialis]
MDLKYAGRDIPWALPFGDHLHSTNSENNSNELKTIAHRYGFQAFDEQLTTSDTNSKWTNPGVVFTDKTIGSDLTAIQNTGLKNFLKHPHEKYSYKNLDFHDDHGHTFCYLCSINQHKHERTKPRDESKKRTLTPYKNPKARLPSFSSSDQIKQNLSSDFISYRFIVRTGTQKNSGTQAKVFLYLYGTESNWTSVHLQKHSNLNSSTSNDGFPSGSVRTFCFKGPNIGQLHHLNVNLVGSRSDKEWFLKEIEITNLNSATTWICEFNCWLPEQDEQQENEIKPNSTHLQTKPSLSMYILQIRTGEKSHTVNNGNAQIKIRGSTNRSGVLTIKNNRANLFERNQLDTFAIVGSDLGDLLEITAELDRSQSATDWHIKDMIIHKLIPDDDHKQSQIYFPFNICLSRKVNQFTAKKEICPSTDYHFKGPICYQVIMKTGNVSNARTDSDVFIMIYGKNGRTAIHQLNSRLNNDTERITASEFIVRNFFSFIFNFTISV